MAAGSPDTPQENAIADLQRFVKANEQTPNQPTSKINAVGNAAFVAGSNILAANETFDTVVRKTDVTIDDQKTNPILDYLIQLTEKIVDIGEVVPILAPAFVVLKIIIEIEQKAREVDAKCQDLLERINFMLSHLVVLEGIDQKIEPLLQVLQRVQDTLKEAAVLIETYRKQGKIVRRLKMSNKENFELVAAKVTTCSTDLMLSLQIQQTGDLSLLKRAVPRDLEAERFVRDHGGEEAINNNPVLVEEFAKKMHLAMSDQVMVQMKANMHDMLQQNQLQIEAVIRQSTSNTVADMAKALSIQAQEHEAAQRLKCIQCDKEYKVISNGPVACGFHSFAGNRCCSQLQPCKTGYHQPEHHCKYPYSNFFLWSYGILGYADMVNYWLNLQEFDLNKDNTKQIVRIGRQIRRKTWGNLMTLPLLLVNVGHVREDLLYYLETFTAAQLEERRKEVVSTGSRLIFKNAAEDEEGAYSKAEWILDVGTQQFTGIKFEVKVSSSRSATTGIVPLDPQLLNMPEGSSVEYLAMRGFEIFLPETPYVFPRTLQLGPTLRETALREVRPFKSKASSGMPLTLLTVRDIVANNSQATARIDSDRFLGLWRGLNTSPLTSPKQIVIMNVKAEYRLVGESEYKPAPDFGFRNDVKLPLTIDPSKAIDIPFEMLIHKPAQVIKKIKLPAINFAHLTVHHPLRVRITLTDVNGETCSLVQEYVHRVNGIPTREDDLIGYFFVDEVDLCQRHVVTVKEPTGSDKNRYVVAIRGHDMYNKLTVEALHKIVYRAEQTGVTEVDLEFGATNSVMSWKVWALIDLNCQRVYGFKVLLEQGTGVEERTSATLGYAPCPLYGGPGLRTRPIQYAAEFDVTPVVQHRDDIEVTVDDTIDDEVTNKPAAMPQHKSESSPEATPEDEPNPSPSPAPKPAVEASNADRRDESNTAVNCDKIQTTSSNDDGNNARKDSSDSANSGGSSSTRGEVVDQLVAKIAMMEARLAAAERHDLLVSRIFALEEKFESKAARTGSNRMEVIESRLESMDKKLEQLGTNVMDLNSNATRVAEALEKIAVLLTP
ncbi:hypothetical protein BG011_006718 [Mortierella polycephala]|uniref:Mixed lineage kinase domain-containing protein n=1 Tax=Mortierella polycephala TaxID=41804 RepID=A0A9P6PVD7_9FUNG|nr:hypothetical protein BG011_006718 [Mortierella polycephala]